MNISNKAFFNGSEEVKDNGTSLLIDRELFLFKDEYKKYFVPNETKPETVGRPYFLHSPDSGIGVLLIHGLMAAPEEVREWADFLHSLDMTVYAPRLSGHGTSSADLSCRIYSDWLDSVDRGHEILKTCCKKIIIAGFSTGAGLALKTAIMKPNDFEAVISVSAPFKFKKFSTKFVEILDRYNRLCNRIAIKRLSMEYVTNHADNPHINYLRCPVGSIVQVKKLMREVRKFLPVVSIPALVLQGSHDPKVDPLSGPAIFRLLGSQKKDFSWIEHDLHGIVRGEVARDVFGKVAAFLYDLGLLAQKN